MLPFVFPLRRASIAFHCSMLISGATTIRTCPPQRRSVRGQFSKWSRSASVALPASTFALSARYSASTRSVVSASAIKLASGSDGLVDDISILRLLRVADDREEPDKLGAVLAFEEENVLRGDEHSKPVRGSVFVVDAARVEELALLRP